MIDILWRLFILISTLAEQILFLYLMEQRLFPKNVSYRRRAIMLAASLALVLLYEGGLPYGLFRFFLLLLNLGYSLCATESVLWKRFTWPLTAGASFICANQLVHLFLSLSPEYYAMAIMVYTPQFFLAKTYVIFLGIIFLILLSRLKPHQVRHSQAKFFTLAAKSLLFILLPAATILHNPASLDNQAAWLMNITLISFMLLAISWTLKSDALAISSDELQAVEADREKRLGEEHFAATLHTLYEHLRDVRHDLKNHLLGLAGLVESGDLAGSQSYLAELQMEITPGELLALTRFPALDAVISAKLKQAKESAIASEVLVVAPGSLGDSVTDICAIMGNILDNAIEAAVHLPEEQRFLRLEALPVGEMWRIRLQNAHNGEFRRAGFEFLTTKNSSGHGIGLRRVRQLAEKNGGYIYIDAAESSFTIEIYLPWVA